MVRIGKLGDILFGHGPIVKIRVQLPARLRPVGDWDYAPEGRAYSPEGGPGFGPPRLPARLRPVGDWDYAPEGRAYSSESVVI